MGVVAYWAEGTKAKPWNPLEGLRFANSDPNMIRLFLRWLDLLGVDPHRLRFTVHIHDSADVIGAERYWADVVGLSADSFRKTLLKRHTPRTNRKNTGQQYHGCLQVYVRMSAQLYRLSSNGRTMGRHCRRESSRPPPSPWCPSASIVP